MEVRCEKCGAIYVINGAIPGRLVCVCGSKKFKKE